MIDNFQTKEGASFWGYGTQQGFKTPVKEKVRPQTNKSRSNNRNFSNTETRTVFNYNRRVSKLAANKLKELLDTEKEIKYTEAQ